MKLSKTDTKILESYIPVVTALAEYLSSYYEIVLHSLENLEHSVICIINGEHTGRQVGAPITDLALSMLKKIETTGQNNVVYFSSNKKGEPLKSTTIAIRGENNRVIGMICINMYLNAPLNDVLESLMDVKPIAKSTLPEAFAQNTTDLVASTFNAEKDKVMADDSILPRNKNKAIIEGLYDAGIFELKDAVQTVVNLLGISKNTIYMHIRNYKTNK
jgi:predicted transcriptional regulator YheO